MKKGTIVFFLLMFIVQVKGQQSDFILIKKHNNRTLKTYYAGTFLSAETYDGFKLNGFITAIRNDSIIIKQHETKLMPTDFGYKIDTLVYSIAIYYVQIKKFNFDGYNVAGKKKGFAQVTIPKLLIIGGIGFITLELINTAYRKESLTEDNKLVSLGIAAAVATTGFVWNYISKHRNKVGGKYKVVYMKANAINNSK